MAKVSVNISMSLDGYIAGPRDSEVQIHLVPILLGGGVRLLEYLDPDQVALERVRMIDSPAVTHLKFRPITGQT